MANPVITNNDLLQLQVFNPVYADATLKFSGIATWAQGVLMARLIASAGSVTPDVGNTGDGTVTALALAPGGPPLPGAWNLECIAAFIAAVVGTPAFTGTGNGVASNEAAGSKTLNGTYILTCVNDSATGFAASGSEVFKVIAPNGDRLDDLTVGVSYSNDHLVLDIADGSTDFVIGDFWTIAMTVEAVPEHGGIFKLEDPNSVIVKSDIALPGIAGGTVTVEVDGMTFILTDDATDFIVGDKFALAITDESLKWVPYVEDALDGSGEAKGVMPAAKTSTGAGDVRWRMLISGEVALAKLSVQAGGTIPVKALEDLRNFTILNASGVRLDILDNQ